jgi:shikimate kinase
MRIYLAGFMASGKSTVGPRVAERLDLGFLDLDDDIERRAGQSIPDIFASEGEVGFRQRETEALWATADRDDLVVALGGGTVIDESNRSFVCDHGLAVFLRVPAATIVDRVAGEAEHRPLLQDETGEPLERDAIHRRIERMLSDRRAAYEDLDVTVDADRPVDEVVGVVSEVAEAWKHRGEVRKP